MIGFVGSSNDPARLRRLAGLVHPLDAPMPIGSSHAEAGFAIAVWESERVPPDGPSSERLRRGDIAVTPDAVLAFEGYLLEDDAAEASGPAAWLLARHARLGPTAFEGLNGAYALAFYDRRARRAWIGACAFGRRDLYYARDGADLLFANDLDRLLRLSARPASLAREQLTSSFLCGASHGGATLIAGVRRALPGALLRVDLRDGDADVTELPPAPLAAEPGPPPQDDAEALEQLEQGLRTAVQRLARVTPRRAVMMSAGVDSSLIAAIVAETTGQLDAVTLGMPAPPDESDQAAAIARALGGTHHVSRFVPGAADPVADMRAFVAMLEEPAWFGLGLAIMTLVRSARTRAEGFVTGVGGDTFFGDALHGAHDPSPDSIFHYVFRMIDAERVTDVVDLQGPHPDAIVCALRERLSRDPAHQYVHIPLITQSGLMIRFASRLARFHRAEALFPYLDRDVVSLALRVPETLRTAEKPLLRALAVRKYPAELQQTDKVPFAAFPVDWLHAAGHLGPLLDVLEEQRTRERGLYHAAGLRRLVDAYRTGTPDRRWNFVLWQVIVFELFCRRFVDSGGLDAHGG